MHRERQPAGLLGLSGRRSCWPADARAAGRSRSCGPWTCCGSRSPWTCRTPPAGRPSWSCASGRGSWTSARARAGRWSPARPCTTTSCSPPPCAPRDRRSSSRPGDGRLELREFIDSWSKVKDHLNRWELELAPVPMELELELGASSASLDLGGLPLRRLRLSQGAADLDPGLRPAQPRGDGQPDLQRRGLPLHAARPGQRQHLPGGGVRRRRGVLPGFLRQAAPRLEREGGGRGRGGDPGVPRGDGRGGDDAHGAGRGGLPGHLEPALGAAVPARWARTPTAGRASRSTRRCWPASCACWPGNSSFAPRGAISSVVEDLSRIQNAFGIHCALD